MQLFQTDQRVSYKNVSAEQYLRPVSNVSSGSIVTDSESVIVDGLIEGIIYRSPLKSKYQCFMMFYACVQLIFILACSGLKSCSSSALAIRSAYALSIAHKKKATEDCYLHYKFTTVCLIDFPIQTNRVNCVVHIFSHDFPLFLAGVFDHPHLDS